VIVIGTYIASYYTVYYSLRDFHTRLCSGSFNWLLLIDGIVYSTFDSVNYLSIYHTILHFKFCILGLFNFHIYISARFSFSVLSNWVFKFGLFLLHVKSSASNLPFCIVKRLLLSIEEFIWTAA